MSFLGQISSVSIHINLKLFVTHHLIIKFEAADVEMIAKIQQFKDIRLDLNTRNMAKK